MQVHIWAAFQDIEKRFIKTGRLGMPGRIEVLSGLKAGERVVLNSSASLEDTSNGGANDE